MIALMKNTTREEILRQLQSGWKLNLYFLKNVPSLWFWGVRIKNVSPQEASVSIPYRWSSTNPYRSMYFAAQAGAAELSTGLLATLHAVELPPTSMLITHTEGSFTKKAVSRTTFTCTDGNNIREALQKAHDSGQPQTVTVRSTGVQENGEIVAHLLFTWSFKPKT
jgi:hypothetical protein